MKIYKYFFLALAVIIIDQTSKLLVHEFMFLHQEITVVGNEQYGFKLHYLLNPGMAFGIRWNNEFGKLGLTVFRIAAMIGIGYYLVKMAKKGSSRGFLWCMALILGGAVGNVIDSTFYGVFLITIPLTHPRRGSMGRSSICYFFPFSISLGLNGSRSSGENIFFSSARSSILRTHRFSWELLSSCCFNVVFFMKGFTLKITLQKQNQLPRRAADPPETP